MTTVEKLLVQIFERKNSIIEQVKQRTELYTQHVVSKLLIDGINPPSWLWDPYSSSNSKELNKEELISKLLCPYPQPSLRCSSANYPFYNNLVATGDYDDLPEKVFMENMDHNIGYHRQHDPMVPEVIREDNAGYTNDPIHEPATSVSSPQGQTDERILNIYNTAEQSLSGIQRSKSRQKALELRNSAKAQVKSGFSNGFSEKMKFSLPNASHGGQQDELELAEPCSVTSQGCEGRDMDGADPLTKGKEMNVPGCEALDLDGADLITEEKEMEVQGCEVLNMDGADLFIEEKHMGVQRCEGLDTDGADLTQMGVQQLEGISNFPIKGAEGRRNSSESADLGNPCAENSGHVTSDQTIVKASEHDTDSGQIYKISEAFQDANIVLEKMVDKPDVKIHPLELNVEHGIESLQEPLREEGKHKGLLMSTPPVSESLGPSHFQNPVEETRLDSSGIISRKLEMKYSISAQISQMFSCLPGEVSGEHVDSPLRDNGCNTSLERRCRHYSIESWPQLKRRKIECQQTHSSTTSPISRFRVPHDTFRGPTSKYLYNIKVNADTSLMGRFDVNVITDADLTEGIEYTISSQKAEVPFCYEVKNVEEDTSSVSNTKQLGPVLVSSLTKQPAQHSQDCFIMPTRTPSASCNDPREPGVGQCSSPEKNFNDHASFENLTLANTLLDIKSSKRESCLQLNPSVLPPSIDDLKFVEVDQSMPVLEGFSVDSDPETDGLDIQKSGINFNKIELPRNTIERASILAEICKSASLDTPLSGSPIFEFQETRNLYQSMSNGHHEHLDMQFSLPSDSKVEEQPHSGSILADKYNDALEANPYSDCVAYSGARSDWNLTNQYLSPVTKPWGRLSLRTEKSSSSNPELVCFTIEEDPCSSEENGSADEHEEEVQENIEAPAAMHHDKRQPFKDLSNLDVNLHVSVPAQAETLKGLDSMKIKFSVTGKQDEFQLIKNKHHKDTRQTREMERSYIGSTDGRESQTLSFGTNEFRNAKESINNSINKSLLSNKASLKGQDPKFSLKESRKNNIVSNMSSFIPLIQQKKVATVCTGKKDVKVKALEAAEAAKRLEEKKEHERKMRKEALKLERAKLEEKNLREIELQKKKKEEEQKKKDAEIIAKKRLREEEARKEKEKKRMKLETRQRQREQEEKLRAEKVQKEKQRSKDVQMQINSKKEFHNGSKKQLNMEPSKGDDRTLKKAENEGMPSDVVIKHQECGTPGQSCEAHTAMHTLDKSPKMEDLIVNNHQGTSYEISPYQCSDDEDEEEDELPTKKYIPSWSSKSSVGLLLPLQQDIDPDVIFPPESFCSIEEVVLPRKLQQKEVAA